jgi:DNA-binding NarL/FixJ family response regulator
MTTAPANSIPPLNQRRQDVLDLLCKGLTNAEIGQQLGLGTRTVKWYVSQLLAMYEATNRTELVGIVVSDGSLSN